jgi:hypothetical protein
MKKVTSDFNSRRTFAQFLASQNSKGKYESTRILDFVKKKRENLIFLKFFISFVVYFNF